VLEKRVLVKLVIERNVFCFPDATIYYDLGSHPNCLSIRWS